MGQIDSAHRLNPSSKGPARSVVVIRGNSAFDKPIVLRFEIDLSAMETTRSRYTVTDWAIGLLAFAVFTIVGVYAVALTRPTGWNVAQWSIFLLWIVIAARLALVVRQRRLQSR